MKIKFHSEFWRELIAFAFFSSVALTLMIPVLPHWATQIYGGADADSTIYAYMVGWMQRALQSGRSPFFDPQLNFPDGLMLTATDVPYLHFLAALPITARFGPLSALNTIILLCHFLSGYVPYLWIRSLTKNRAAGVVAGLAFVLAPYRSVHIMHLNLIATHVLVLFFWALDNALAKGAASTCSDKNAPISGRDLGLLTLATFYAGGTSQYYLAICLICGALYLILMNWRAWTKIVPALLLGALLSALPYLVLLGTGTFESGHVESRFYSASPLDFVIPSTQHPLWGDWVARTLHIGNSEQTIYIGLAAFTLALLALRHNNDANSLEKQRLRAWIGVSVMAAIFALGTDLHLTRAPLNETHPLWLPAYYLGLLPFAGIMRVWARFGIVSILFVTLLAGVGVARWMERIPHANQMQRRGVALLCAALVTLDLATRLLAPQALSLRPIDRWLMSQPGNFAAAFLPFPQHIEPNFKNAYGSLWHRKYLPMAVHPMHQPPAFRRFRRLAMTFPDARSIGGLQAMGFRYLLLNSAQFDGVNAANWRDVESALRHWSGARFVDRVGTIVIVQLPALSAK